MEGIDLQSFPKIKPMRAIALHAGIKLEPAASMPNRFARQPVDEFAAVAGRSSALVRHEIVDIKILGGEKGLQIAIACDGPHFSPALEKGEKISLYLLTLHLPNEFSR